jgi:hypothetical protein
VGNFSNDRQNLIPPSGVIERKSGIKDPLYYHPEMIDDER